MIVCQQMRFTSEARRNAAYTNDRDLREELSLRHNEWTKSRQGQSLVYEQMSEVCMPMIRPRGIPDLYAVWQHWMTIRADACPSSNIARMLLLIMIIYEDYGDYARNLEFSEIML